MKAVIILTLVLTVYSAANANLTWSVNEIELNIGQSATVTISSDNSLCYGDVCMGNYESPVARVTGACPRPAAGANASCRPVTAYPGWWFLEAVDFNPDDDPNGAVTAGVHWDVNIVALSIGTHIVHTDYFKNAGNDDEMVINVVEIPECFNSNHPDYNEWISVGKPACWCYKYQCCGDADGRKLGNSKSGYYHVEYQDLSLVLNSWKKGDNNTSLNICADVDRKKLGNSKSGYYRVEYQDLTIVLFYWKLSDSQLDSQCPFCAGSNEP